MERLRRELSLRQSEYKQQHQLGMEKPEDTNLSTLSKHQHFGLSQIFPKCCMSSHVVGELYCLPNWSSILRSRRVTHRGVGLSCSNGFPDAPPSDPEFVLHKLLDS